MTRDTTKDAPKRIRSPKRDIPNLLLMEIQWHASRSPHMNFDRAIEQAKQDHEARTSQPDSEEG